MASIGDKRKLSDTEIVTTKSSETPPKQQRLVTDVIENTKQTESEQITENNETVPIPKKVEDKKEEEIDPSLYSSLRDQIEFYFGDSNYSLDTHILYQIRQNNGYFPIYDLLKFQRIQQMTKNIKIIKKIIRESSKLELNEKEDGVKRHSSLNPAPSKEDIFSRTIFAKGFHPRYSIDQLSIYWKTQTKSENDILSVRPMRKEFTVGMGGDGKPKFVKRFLGDCSVEFTTVDLAKEFSQLTFNSDGRTIVCGMYDNYNSDEYEWKIKPKYYEFESSKVLYIYNIPTVSTYKDVKNWICNSLVKNRYNKWNQKKNCSDKVEYVHKDIGSAQSYARFSTSSNIEVCVNKMKNKPFLGLSPGIKLLDDELAKQIWKKVAMKRFDISRDVEINIKQNKSSYRYKQQAVKKENNNKNNEKKHNKEKDEEDEGDEDIDIKDNKNNKEDDVQENSNKSSDVKEETTSVKNEKKHKLDDAEIPPAKKQRVD